MLGKVDPSGLVKGWSVDRGGELLEGRGLANYSINAGGDIRMRGAALPDPRWRTGIQHPVLHDRIAAVVEANDLALATSGTYIRGEHIVDPHTGAPPSGLLSVSIAGPDLATADAYATAAFAMGEDGAAVVGDAAPLRGVRDPRRRAFVLDAGLPARQLTHRDGAGVRHHRLARQQACIHAARSVTQGQCWCQAPKDAPVRSPGQRAGRRLRHRDHEGMR